MNPNPARRFARTHIRRIALIVAGMLTLSLALLHIEPAEPTLAQDDFPNAPQAPGRIVYTRQDSEDSSAFDMFTSDPNGENETKLSDISESIAGEFQPRWSPDGTRIVFATGDRLTGLASYWLIGHQGGDPERVVENDGRGKDPAWSPDGRCFAFSGAHGDGIAADHDRYDIKIWCDGEGVITLMSTPDMDERDPDWSPDGERILYVARAAVRPTERTERWSLYTVGLDGSDPTLILDWWGSHERVPRWSPDGKTIAFVVSDNPEWVFGTLHIFSPDTGEIAALVRKPAASISWSPDGGSLLFSNVDDLGVSPLGAGLTSFVERLPGLFEDLVVQNKGLYLYDLVGRSVSRLTGHAGGREKDDFQYGYAPDWTAGTATPTPIATATFTPSPTSEATDTPTASATPSSTSPGRRTSTPTSTGERPPTEIYLPWAESESDAR